MQLQQLAEIMPLLCCLMMQIACINPRLAKPSRTQRPVTLWLQQPRFAQLTVLATHTQGCCTWKHKNLLYSGDRASANARPCASLPPGAKLGPAFAPPRAAEAKMKRLPSSSPRRGLDEPEEAHPELQGCAPAARGVTSRPSTLRRLEARAWRASSSETAAPRGSGSRREFRRWKQSSCVTDAE